MFRRMTNHETRNCFNQPRGDPEGRPGPHHSEMERERPVLGSQPSLSGTTHVRYVETKDNNPCYDIVPSSPYVEGESSIGYDCPDDREENLPLMIMGAGRGRTPDTYAKRAPLTSGVPRPCFRCHGDHWVRDCPYEIADKGGAREPDWPRVPRHYIACGSTILQRIVHPSQQLVHLHQKQPSTW